MAGSVLLARRARRADTLLASRRLADNPKGSFRAISGLVLAVFMATVAVALISSMTASHALQTGGAAGKNIVLVDLSGPELPNAGPTGVTVPSSLVTRLRAIDGVTAVLVSHLDRAGTADDSLVDCAQLAPAVRARPVRRRGARRRARPGASAPGAACVAHGRHAGEPA